MATVFSISPLKQVHDINVTTSNGRAFVIDIFTSSAGNFDASVIAHDKISANPGSWLFAVPQTNQPPNQIFEHAMRLIQQYLAQNDTTDNVATVINPCNDPFVKIAIQNLVLPKLGIPSIAQ